MADYTELAKVLKACWEFECSEDCPWYDYSPDEGFHCRRYKSFDLVEKFLDEAVKMLKDK